MKVLHLIPMLEPGGAQKLLVSLLPVQRAMGLEVELAVYLRLHNGLERALETAGVNIVSLEVRHHRNMIGTMRVVCRLRRLFRSYDMVHVHLFPALYHAALAADSGTPMVYTEHGVANRRRLHPFPFRLSDRWAYGRFSAVVAVSGAAAASLSGWLGEGCRRTGGVGVVYNGVASAMPEDVCRAKSSGPAVLAMAARFVEGKDQRTLVRALALMAHRDVEVVFAGDGPTLEECRSMARRLGVADRCSFPGHVDDMAAVVACADIGVHLSDREGFGLAPVEFMATGKPVVVSDIPGLREAVGEAGMYVGCRDAWAVAHALDSLLSDREAYCRLAEAGRRQAALFSISRCAEAYLDIYMRSLANVEF